MSVSKKRQNSFVVAIFAIALAISHGCGGGGAPEVVAADASTCGSGQTSCGSRCTDFSNDQNNCGACGNVCPAGLACAAGHCTTACGVGAVMCANGDASYCANTSTDNANCGTCGHSCASGTVCAAGACATTCGALTTCTSDAGAPYCANTSTDNANCDTCGHSCASGTVCAGGACATTCGSLTTCTSDAGAPYCANTSTDNANCGTCGHTCPGATGCTIGVCQPAGPACNPATAPNASTGVFVDGATGNDTTGTGTLNAPYKTVSAAIAAAITSAKANVFVAPRTYSESLTLADSPLGLSIIGGWVVSAGVWSTDCGANASSRTVLQGDAIAIRAHSVSHPVLLAHMSILTLASAVAINDTPGTSLIGVLVEGSGSIVQLDDVTVVSGNAAAGGAASDGAAGTGAQTCDGLTDCGTGATGVPGAPGGPAAGPGTFGSAGFAPADGQSGAKSNGTNGVAGGSGASAGYVVSCWNTCGGTCGTAVVSSISGGDGLCGCGAISGSPGQPGRGGGASAAVVVTGTGCSVSVSRSALSAGSGGAGSTGANGGAGNAGAAGAGGASVTHSSLTCGSSGKCGFANLYTQCGNTGSSVVLAPGGSPGGHGGTGGTGGKSGGGAGGPSYTVVIGSGAAANIDRATTLAFTAGGSGGGGAPDGAASALHGAP